MKQHIFTATFFGAALLLPCLTLGQTPDNPASLALEKARNDLASANKSLSEQSPSKKEALAKVSLAKKKLLAETAWTARQEVAKAEAAKKTAEKPWLPQQKKSNPPRIKSPALQKLPKKPPWKRPVPHRLSKNHQKSKT